MFEKASRLRLKFKLSNGVVSTEDLWGLSLESLNAVAVGLHKEIKDSDDISFISDKSGASEHTLLRFEIVKHVIGVLLSEKQSANDKVEKDAMRAKLLQLIDNKKDSALSELSVKELLKKVNKL